MAKYSKTLTADGTASFDLKRPRHADFGRYTLFAVGDFGSGTVTAEASPDGGTTDVAIKDSSGNAVSETAAFIVNFELMSDADNPVKLEVNLASSTDPDLDIYVFDNS